MRWSYATFVHSPNGWVNTNDSEESELIEA